MPRIFRYILLLIAVAAIGSLLYYILAGSPPEAEMAGIISFAISFGHTVTITASCFWLIDTLNKRLPWKTAARKRLLYEISSIILISLTVAFVFGLISPNISWHNRSEFVEGFKYNALIAVPVTVIIVSIFEGSVFFREWKNTLLEQERLQKAHLQAQYNNLKNQLNPHFLFNSLNTLTSLIELDQERAVAYLQNISKYLRIVLTQTNEEVISVREELELVQLYINIQKERFGESIKLEISLPDEVKQQKIAPLALQMLVENAIKHNVVSATLPLKILIAYEPGFITVSNKKQAKKQLEGGAGIGLQNIKKRYELLNGHAPIIIDEDFFTVKIPVLELSI
ncbi:hypothetical protein GC194_00800 [bacterium]|nr:hypothetical protein [bacterium]